MKNTYITFFLLISAAIQLVGCGGADQATEPRFFQGKPNTSGVPNPTLARGVYILNDYTGLECNFDQDNQWWVSKATDISSYFLSIYPNVPAGSNNDPNNQYRFKVYTDPLFTEDLALESVIFNRALEDTEQVIEGNLTLPNGSTKFYRFKPIEDVDYEDLESRRILTAQQFCDQELRDNVDALNFEEGPVVPTTAENMYGNRILEGAEEVSIPGSTAFITINDDIGAAPTLVESEDDPTNFVEVTGTSERVLVYKFKLPEDRKLASFNRAYIRTGALETHTMFAYSIRSDDPLSDISNYIDQTPSPDSGLLLTNLNQFDTYYIIFVPKNFTSDVVNESLKVRTDFGTEARTIAPDLRPFKFFIEALVFQ